jgi:hypothetical protein
MVDGGVFRTPCADFSRLVEESLSFFCGKMYRWGKAYVECHMDPNISIATTDKERVITEYPESQSTSRVPNRTPVF